MKKPYSKNREPIMFAAYPESDKDRAAVIVNALSGRYSLGTFENTVAFARSFEGSGKVEEVETIYVGSAPIE